MSIQLSARDVSLKAARIHHNQTDYPVFTEKAPALEENEIILELGIREAIQVNAVTTERERSDR